MLIGLLWALPARPQQAEFFQEPDTTTIIAREKLDLNSASLAQVRALPDLPEGLAKRIVEYRFQHGALTSIYQLMEVEGMTPLLLKQLKQQVKIQQPPAQTQITKYIADLQDRLASEENPGTGAIDEWESMLLHPLNVNRATIEDLLLLNNVTAIDAAAVVRHIKTQGELQDWRSLQRNVHGLSYYGFSNMRNYVTVSPPVDKFYFDGDYRIRTSWNDRLDSGDEGDFRYLGALIQASIANFKPGSAEWDTMTVGKMLENGGWTNPEIAAVKAQMISERDYLAGLPNHGSLQQRLVANVGGHFRVGGLWQQEAYEDQPLVKGYACLNDIGPLDKLILGNYRVTVGQGIVMDNADDDFYASRRTSRAPGLFGDITPTQEFALRGMALEASYWRIKPTLFFSSDPKDGILNRDGTVNSYFVVNPRFPQYRDVFTEQTAGFSLSFNLDDVLSMPVGTSIGLSGYQAHYDRPFKPSAIDLDLPGDKNELSDPNYTQLWSGSTRQVGGVNFRTVVDNLSVEGEAGKLRGGGTAYNLSSRLQYETVYLLLMQRHYDVDYDNPYCRSFLEQVKFDDTILEKEYRLIDPVYKQMVNYPAPKAEQGTYLETRWQISRQFTITRAYIDFWKNLAYGLNNVRFQGEVEYRPVFPVHFRLKQKWQSKYLPKSAWPTRSNTRETTLRAFATLSQRDYLNAELRYGEVRLTPSEAYGGDVLMSGAYLGTNFEHNFTPTWDLKAGIASWRTDDMSQWIFEDAGIDFLLGDGIKYYTTVSDRLSDNLQVRLRVRGKDSRYSYNGIYGSESAYYYGGLPGVPVRDFMDSRDLWTVDLQLDLRW